MLGLLSYFELMHDVSILIAGNSSIKLCYINMMKKYKEHRTYNLLVLSTKTFVNVIIPYAQDMSSNYNVEGLSLNGNVLSLKTM